MSTTLFSNAYSFFENMNWDRFSNHCFHAADKTRYALLSGQAFTTLPVVAIATYSAYQSANHLKTALFGTDSKAYRFKLLEKAYSNSENEGAFKRASKVQRAVFGSISLYGRAIETGKSALNLGLSFISLYALYAYTHQKHATEGYESTQAFEDNVQQPLWEQGLKVSEYELEPELNDYNKRLSALDQLSRFQYFTNHTLIRPESPENNPNLFNHIKLVDDVFRSSQHQTPLEVTKNSIQLDLSTLFDWISAPKLDKSTEEMSIEELQEGYRRAKESLLQHAPTEGETLVANLVGKACNNTFGFFTQTGCQSLKDKIQPIEQTELYQNLKKLDQLYEVVLKRAHLFGRDLNGSLSHYASMSPEQLERLGSYLTDITKSLKKELPLDIKTNLKEKAACFMGISENFTKAEFKRAYRKLSLILHPDRQEGSTQGMEILGSFQNLFKEYDVFNTTDFQVVSDIESTNSTHFNMVLPTPFELIPKLFNEFVQWYNQTSY